MFHHRYITLFATILSLGACLCGLSGCSKAEAVAAPDTRELLAMLDDRTEVNPYDIHLDTAPDGGCERLRIKPIGQLRKVFNDSNYTHLEAARAIGIAPITGDADIMHLRRPVVRVASCREYFLDELTHSYPYLVPEAAKLLRDIGSAFKDSLDAQGGGNYRIKVTSVLRTPATVSRLRRVNRNATEESTHSYGTTFDISYSKFICDSIGAKSRTFEDLKNVLAVVLYDMREQGRCFVKYEVHQSCFHITTRPSTANTPLPD